MMIVKPGFPRTKTYRINKASLGFAIRVQGAFLLVLQIVTTAAPTVALACESPPVRYRPWGSGNGGLHGQPFTPASPSRRALSEDLETDAAGSNRLRPNDLQYRYRIIGRGHQWVYAGVRRSVDFNDLPPGQYSIEVIACRPDEPCARTPAKIMLVHQPPWFTAWWVRWTAALTLLAGAAVLFEWRMRSLARGARLRFEDRLAERTRVARDLHDTLMQTVLASKVMADTSRSETDAIRLQATMSRLSSSLGQAAQEGRAAVEALRPPGQEDIDLAAALELAALDGRHGAGLSVRVSMSGKRQALHPTVQQEALKIGYEAVRNACIHSRGHGLRIHLAYDNDLVLTIEDDGEGLPESFIANGRPGHFGLVGMRERAEHLGGTLRVSNLYPGVRIRLWVPGATAFVRRRWRSAGLRALKALVTRTTVERRQTRPDARGTRA